MVSPFYLTIPFKEINMAEKTEEKKASTQEEKNKPLTLAGIISQKEKIEIAEGVVVHMKLIPMDLFPRVARILFRAMEQFATKGEGEEIPFSDIAKIFAESMDDAVDIMNKCTDEDIKEIPLDYGLKLLERFVEINFTGDKIKNWLALMNKFTGGLDVANTQAQK
jgi:hypothetical protein